MSEMSFAQAKNHVMSLGKHRGRSIDSIAVTDDGLRYLDWLYDKMSDEPPSGGINAVTFEALCVYMSDPTIQKELANL